MRAPLSWLRDFAPFPTDAGDLAARLSGLGLVVEAVSALPSFDGVVAARVVGTNPHPDADRVQLVEVHDGGGSRQIVCGAFNFGPGDMVALATVGTVLPGGMEIARRKVRGQWSEGMLCSAAELDLGSDHSGIMILPVDTEPGTPVAEALGLAGDIVFDIDVTPNRPDALCMLGIARDLAANLGLALSVAEFTAEVATTATVDLALDAGSLCPRFTATLVEGVAGARTPAWMAARLTMAGMRPINPVVDISNYVMLELGQPNHPYDRARLGGGGLAVRPARPDEELVTLDGLTRVLGPGDCLICDSTGTPVGIGGIMGGAPAEIADTTSTVVLEVAAFDPMAVARTSRRLGLRTEASVRFERGVDPGGLERAVARFCQLAAELTGAKVGPTVDGGEGPGAAGAVGLGGGAVTVRTPRVNRLLGTDLTTEEIRGLLEPIGFTSPQPPAASDEVIQVTIPTWRPDSFREVDVIEEVARHRGYNRIARTTPAVRGQGHLTDRQRERRRLREVLAGAGLSEAWSSSLMSVDDLARAGVSVDAVELANPLAKDESVLRTSLRPGLLRAAVTNAAHRNPEVALFELGRVFSPAPAADGLPVESEHLAAIGTGRSVAWAKGLLDGLIDELDLPGEVRSATVAGLHPGRGGRLVDADGGVLAVVGEVDPDVVAGHGLVTPVAYLEVDLDAVATAPRQPRPYRPVSRYPSADFDLAFVLDDAVPAGDLRRALVEGAGEFLEEIDLFDVFRGQALGEGRRSLAYRLRVVAQDRTLDDAELAGIRDRCIGAGLRTGAQLRA